MPTQISPMLAVSDGKAAIAFYKAAFGAELLWHLDGQVAGLSIDGAKFLLAHVATSRRARPSRSRLHNSTNRTLRERPYRGTSLSFGRRSG